MPKVSINGPVRPPVSLPQPRPQEKAVDRYVRVINPKGSAFTSRRRADKFVSRGHAVWVGNAIRFVHEYSNTAGMRRAQYRAALIETCAATVARRRELQRAEMERSAPGSHSQSEWNAIVALHEGRCACCGVNGVVLTKDHIVPLSKGGSNSAINLQPLCCSCNSSKGTRIVGFRPRSSD